MAAITPDGGAAAVGDDASDSISLPSGPTPSTGEEARSCIAEFAQTVSTYRSHIATVQVGGHPPHRPAAVTPGSTALGSAACSPKRRHSHPLKGLRSSPRGNMRLTMRPLTPSTSLACCRRHTCRRAAEGTAVAAPRLRPSRSHAGRQLPIPRAARPHLEGSSSSRQRSCRGCHPCWGCWWRRRRPRAAPMATAAAAAAVSVRVGEPAAQLLLKLA